MQELPPLYPVDIWNVHETTLLGRSRTNNLCESWNNGLFQIVGHYHPSVWTLIDALRQDNAVAETEIAKSHRGQPPKKRQACNDPATGTSAENLQRSCDECEICCGDIECCCAHDSLSVVSETGYVNEN